MVRQQAEHERQLAALHTEQDAFRLAMQEKFMSLRGNLRVMVRLRPLLAKAGEPACEVDIGADGQQLALVTPDGCMGQRARRWTFDFDRCVLTCNVSAFLRFSL
jgi:hypothetical protein